MSTIADQANGFRVKCKLCPATFVKTSQERADQALRMHTARAHTKTMLTRNQKMDGSAELSSNQRRRQKLIALGLDPYTKGKLSDLEAGLSTSVEARIAEKNRKSKSVYEKRRDALAQFGLPTTTKGRMTDIIARMSNGHAQADQTEAVAVQQRREPAAVAPQNPTLTIRFCPGCGNDLLPYSFGSQIGAMLSSMPSGVWRGAKRPASSFRYCPSCSFDLSLIGG